MNEQKTVATKGTKKTKAKAKVTAEGVEHCLAHFHKILGADLEMLAAT